MAKVSKGPSRPAGPRADNDVYTVLTCVAFLFMLVATVYVGYRAVYLFETVLPPAGG